MHYNRCPPPRIPSTSSAPPHVVCPPAPTRLLVFDQTGRVVLDCTWCALVDN
ncbi:hypothetical protein OE88DRAFT_1652288 [Heliocybe sulcata]|uniref:Uncharacterized protein n=1 Tax=Heliocybe sulcata TaxID=5364 RepID=A0A5C3NDM5_9AGAM|nr:hypothetical protein OE88DRAFT_1652288 [Heliocybe sulcata]